MAAYFTLTLDTTAPSGGSIFIPQISNVLSILATLSATDATFMKIYGDIAATSGSSVAISENDAQWVAYNTSASLYLTTGDGTKTVYVKFKDDVGNVSSAASATCVLDTTGAVVVIVGPDVSKISKQTGFNISSFSFSANESFDEWSVRFVPSSMSTHDAGTEIPTAGGSTNMHGTTTIPASTAVNCTITGSDLETASSGDGAKIIKVFVKDLVGNWSV